MKKWLLVLSIISISFAISTLAFAKAKIPLTESSIILPLKDNDGNELSAAHTKLGKLLLAHWSGYTTNYVTGSWLATSGQLVQDASVIYIIAMPCSKKEQSQLRSLIKEIKQSTKQEAIYLKACTGQVQFI